MHVHIRASGKQTNKQTNGDHTTHAGIRQRHLQPLILIAVVMSTSSRWFFMGHRVDEETMMKWFQTEDNSIIHTCKV